MKNTKIFISHSSRDKLIAEFICNYLIGIGVHWDEIFCTSVPEHGVVEKISREICNALKASIIDVIILTPNYQKSSYCLNEAGAIWFKENSLKLLIAQPGLSHQTRIGFIDGDTIFHYLNDKNFVSSLYDKISFRIPCLHSRNTPQLENAREALIAVLPTSSNLINYSEHVFDVTASQKILQNCIGEYTSKCVDSHIFYQRYSRCITIAAADTPGYIHVITDTQMTVVNMSEHSHTECFKPQFLKENGGLRSYKLYAAKDGKVLDTSKVFNRNLATEIGSRSAYAYPDGFPVPVDPHSISDISLESTYDIPIEMFFQSKILGYPCVEYTLTAQFDDSFKNSFHEKYIFRYQVSPPDSRNPTAVSLSSSTASTTLSKDVVSISFRNGTIPGTGYALAISKLVPEENKQSADDPEMAT